MWDVFVELSGFAKALLGVVSFSLLLSLLLMVFHQPCLERSNL